MKTVAGHWSDTSQSMLSCQRVGNPEVELNEIVLFDPLKGRYHYLAKVVHLGHDYITLGIGRVLREHPRTVVEIVEEGRQN